MSGQPEKLATAQSAAPVPPGPTPGDVPPDATIKLSRRGNINFSLAIFVVLIGGFYYYRHYAEIVGALAAGLVAGGFLTALIAFRSVVWGFAKKQFMRRAANRVSRLLNHKLTRWALLVVLLLEVVLLLTTSSIVLTYDANVSSPPFRLVVNGNGDPFRVQELAINGTHRIAGEVFHGWFSAQDVTFDIKSPIGFEVPPSKPFRAFSRLRLHVPSSFNKPAVYLVTIVPGPNLLSSLPGATTVQPPKRYYLKLRSRAGETLLTNDFRKGIVVTGAELRYLSSKLDNVMATDLPIQFNGRFEERLEGASLALLTSTIYPIGSPRLEPHETITIEAGHVRPDGSTDSPLATTTVLINDSNQFAFPERRL